ARNRARGSGSSQFGQALTHFGRLRRGQADRPVNRIALEQHLEQRYGVTARVEKRNLRLADALGAEMAAALEGLASALAIAPRGEERRMAVGSHHDPLAGAIDARNLVARCEIDVE